MFGRDRVWGKDGETGWNDVLPISGFDGLEVEGEWRRVADEITATALSGSASVTFGATEWRDYELSVEVTAYQGANIQIAFRRSDDRKRYYMMDFLFGWQAVAISRVDNTPEGKGLEKLSVVNYQLVRGAAYSVEIAARELSITTYIDGKLINQVTDDRIRQGKISLSVWQAKISYRRPKFRVLG